MRFGSGSTRRLPLLAVDDGREVQPVIRPANIGKNLRSVRDANGHDAWLAVMDFAIVRASDKFERYVLRFPVISHDRTSQTT